MKRHPRVLSVVFTGLLAGALGLPDMASAQGTRVVTEEILSTWAGYSRAFAEGRVDFIADSVYTTPSFHGLADGMQTLTTTDEIRDLFRAALTSARAQGYDRSVTRSSTVCPLSDDTALLSVEYARYRADGEVLSESAGTYLFTRTSDGWRILGQIGHTADRRVGCAG